MKVSASFPARKQFKWKFWLQHNYFFFWTTSVRPQGAALFRRAPFGWLFQTCAKSQYYLLTSPQNTSSRCFDALFLTETGPQIKPLQLQSCADEMVSEGIVQKEDDAFKIAGTKLILTRTFDISQGKKAHESPRTAPDHITCTPYLYTNQCTNLVTDVFFFHFHGFMCVFSTISTCFFTAVEKKFLLSGSSSENSQPEEWQSFFPSYGIRENQCLCFCV